ncbi:uncharacterized protein LOC119067125 [Bradysia coprophila]|uniref:uncharacterized protein LOC119067125 n=1 Tax=Bradysia coprophila TaxID=38358 RepID=UPI00187DB9BE|nr:uncharacterized protein LOC119067125 [Bradysia coprophila]XP_037025809.1 uncharacterized protein LOC119067125 [Bradysia coprophila]XP_037025817.1 uncharacterized protein LOC119067125 [Bradysia coprophila]XP_037025827.1 uncharacterized protein LOC119067125 [Bradysia coprophila]
MNAQTETPNRACCMAPPPVIFLFVTLLVTTGTTALLCGAIMSDHWENVTWDKTILEKLTHNNTTNALEWQLNGRVAIVTVQQGGRRDNLFLVPMHGGIWTLCIDITDSDMRFLGRSGFPNTRKCVNYLADEVVLSGDDLYRNTGFPSNNHPRIRMQNLSISCSLVCMIILGSAALVGAFGVCQRQISAILVTGVMYLLAALFGLFTLMIIYVKRQQEMPDNDFDGTIEGLIAPKSVSHLAKSLFEARIFSKSWSLSLGWCGVLMCSITSGMWILLSKIMRYNSYSST